MWSTSPTFETLHTNHEYFLFNNALCWADSKRQEARKPEGLCREKGFSYIPPNPDSPRPDPPAATAGLGALGPGCPLRPGGTPLRVAGPHLPSVPGTAVLVRPVRVPRRRKQAVPYPLRCAASAGCCALK